MFLSSILAGLVFLLLFFQTPPEDVSLADLSENTRSSFFEGPSLAVQNANAKLLSYDAKNFTLDGRAVRIVSGSVHYFRMPPTRWRPVLEYARAMGLNAIETYVPWNLHEQVKGSFRFSGMLDLRAFLEVAHDLGLLVLLRPGPYICSEWDLGGLPPYLLADENMKLRSTHPAFMRAVIRYFAEVHAQIDPYIGKPIAAIQIENEYGAYGEEKAYLDALLSAWEGYGYTRNRVMFFTSDNGGPKTVSKGSPFDSAKVLKTINLEWNVKTKVGMLRTIQPSAPAMIAEFWTGWFDHWGENHHVRDGSDVVNNVRATLIDADASINLYMFFGGTNFGFMSGANMESNMTYLADVTSYDYDGFITEYGGIRKEKYLPMQTMIRRFWKAIGDREMYEASQKNLPKDPKLSAYAGPVSLQESISLYDVLDTVSDNVVLSGKPLSMEQLGGDYGFVMYRHNLTRPRVAANSERVVEISGVRDFAYILADGAVVKTVDRNREREKDGTLKTIRIQAATKRLDLIVENRGRVNYGAHIHDRKGILGEVKVDGVAVEGFECRTMSFPQDHPLLPDVQRRATISSLRGLMRGRNDRAPLQTSSSPPTFFRGEMTINPGSIAAFGGELPGTHCRVFGRGVLWVNGFNVGRFHTGVAAPQRSLFVPGAVLREGRNEFMVLHMNMYLARDPPKVQLFEQPDLGPVN